MGSSLRPGSRRLLACTVCAALLAGIGGAGAADVDDDAAAVTSPPQQSQSRREHPDPPGQLPPTAPHPNAQAGLALQYGGTPIDASTYHYDNLRTGWNKTETDLTQATVRSAKFGLLHTLAVDGSVLAQPLLISGFQLPDGSRHDVLVIVTEHNSVYAFDARTYAQLWRVNLGKPQLASDVGCSHVNPEYGISATPVIVRSAVDKAAIYLVSSTEPQARQFHTLLHKLDLGTGQDMVAPVEIAASATMSDGSTIRYSAPDQWIRAGLVHANGTIYIAASSHCDGNAGRIAGWLMRYGLDLRQRSAFSTIETPAGYQLAAIWMSGFAPAADADGNVFAITGNGNFAKGGKDWGESVIKLPPTLARVNDFFTPANFDALNGTDRDFGSGGVMLLPVVAGQVAPPMAVAMGKDAVMYLLDRGALGGKKANDAGALQAQRLASGGGGVWGGPAYYRGPDGGVVYYQISFDRLRAFSVATGAEPKLTPTVQGTTTAGWGGSLPIVSSNGGKPGTGVVWVIRRGGTVQLEAYDAEHLGTPLYAASAGSWPNGGPFLTPLQANGRVYVPATGTVSIFGLTP